MPKTVPCLWFDGQAEAAAEHYCAIFPNSRITHVAPRPEGMPGSEDGSALAVSFELDGREYAGLNGGPEFTFTEAVSFQIHCADQAEVDHYWSKLSEGGEESVCGWLKDKFGLSWQVVPTRMFELLSDPDPGRAGRATQAMLGMRKLDIAELERAADAA